jgi:hypothetical protein
MICQATSYQGAPSEVHGNPGGNPRPAYLFQRIAIAGFILFAVSAPHSIAAAEIGLGLAALGWLGRTLVTSRTGFRHTTLDLPIWLYLAWSIASAVLSQEPAISLAKLQTVSVLFVFYLAQAIISRGSVIVLVSLMIASGVVGTLWSIMDLARGRGVVVESIAADSPFGETPLGVGDAVWRIRGSRVYSVAEIDDAIRNAPPGSRLTLSAISRGEHAEWSGPEITAKFKERLSPSGLAGSARTHRFRASGWTRHYEAFAEILQILTQLSLGMALANLRRRGWINRLWFAAAAILGVGVALSAMRTVAAALAIGAAVVLWRAAKGRARLLTAVAVAAVLAVAIVAVWQTRASNALRLEDNSVSLRWQVARIGLSRVMLHPLFGHGMDAMHNHWTEWGFPGSDMIHMHSTPLQLAFDRGLPALVFWLWILVAFWLQCTRAEAAARGSSDVSRHGLLLGATGALAGFAVSSIVNYNIGTAVVALVFWWLMGMISIVAAGDAAVLGSPSLDQAKRPRDSG